MAPRQLCDHQERGLLYCQSSGPKSDENFYQSREKTKFCLSVKGTIPVGNGQGLKLGVVVDRGSRTTGT